MVDPDRHPEHAHDTLDLRETRALTTAEVRAVLESAADVMFSDGVSAEFLDQWTFETVQLLEARARTDAARERVRPVSAGRS